MLRSTARITSVSPYSMDLFDVGAGIVGDWLRRRSGPSTISSVAGLDRDRRAAWRPRSLRERGATARRQNQPDRPDVASFRRARRASSCPAVSPIFFSSCRPSSPKGVIRAATDAAGAWRRRLALRGRRRRRCASASFRASSHDLCLFRGPRGLHRGLARSGTFACGSAPAAISSGMIRIAPDARPRRRAACARRCVARVHFGARRRAAP